MAAAMIWIKTLIGRNQAKADLLEPDSPLGLETSAFTC
jgi:hypothetical protein